MAVAASMVTIVLFLAFMTAGAQKVVFNPFMSQTAERLGFTKVGFRRLGASELIGAIGLLVGLASKGDALARVNEAAAVVLVLATLVLVIGHLRAGDSIRRYGPVLAMGALALTEMVVRLTL
ncbi:MAG: DoxX family protein [Acidimicrobiales bacterium]